MKSNTAVVLLLLSVGLFYTFTTTEYEEAQRLNVLANEYQSVLKDVSQISEIREQLAVTYGAFPKTDLDRLNKMLPDNIDTVDLAVDLDTLSSQFGVAITDIQAEAGISQNSDVVVLPENMGPYDRGTITINFIANHPDFMALLGDFEKNLRVMDIKSITFDTSDNGLYEYTLTAETYWLR